MKIMITIKNNGNDLHIETEGFQGSACIQATQGIEAAFGGATGNRAYKPEYNQLASVVLGASQTIRA